MVDFHKPGICGSARVWAYPWNVFRRAPSRVGRGRQAAVDFVVCFGCGGFFRFFLKEFLFYFERTQPAASMRPAFLVYLSTSTGVRTGCQYLISLCVRVCNIRRFY